MAERLKGGLMLCMAVLKILGMNYNTVFFVVNDKYSWVNYDRTQPFDHRS